MLSLTIPTVGMTEKIFAMWATCIGKYTIYLFAVPSTALLNLFNTSAGVARKS